MKKAKKQIVIGGFVVLCLVTAGLLFVPKGIKPSEAALAEYQLQNLTCGSCVSNIEAALASLDGIGMIDINLTSNRGRISFDPAVVDSRQISETVRAAGYPADLRLELSPEEYTALRNKQARLGQKYVAKIGDRLIPRAEFESLVAQRKTSAQTSPSQQARLWQTVWSDLLQRELLLSAAEQNNIIVQPGEVDQRLAQMRQGHQQFERLITDRYGSMDRFRALVREDMIITRNLDEHVFAGQDNPQTKQMLFERWFSDLQQNTDVVIFDPQLQASSQGGSGCACCNS